MVIDNEYNASRQNEENIIFFCFSSNNIIKWQRDTKNNGCGKGKEEKESGQLFCGWNAGENVKNVDENEVCVPKQMNFDGYWCFILHT